jgi:hypothetical protein
MTSKVKPTQIQKFREAARAMGCDESEDNFKDALRMVAKHKPVAPENELADLIEKSRPADMERIAKKIGNTD